MIRVDGIERVRVRPIEEIPSSPISIAPIQLPNSAQSTIAPAAIPDGHKPSLLRPSLTAPLVDFMYPIIRVYEEMERLVHLEILTCDRETKNSLNRLMELDKQKIEMLRQRAKDFESRDTWKVFQTVSQYIASSAAIVLGITLLGPAPVASAFLIASGGLGLLNRAVSDSGLWEWVASRFTASVELQRLVSERIDSCMVYLSTALALFGAINAYQAGALALLPDTGRDVVMNKALQILAIGNGALRFISRCGIARMEKKIQNLTQEIKNQETQMVCVRQEIQIRTPNLKRIIELSETIAENVKQAIESQHI